MCLHWKWWPCYNPINPRVIRIQMSGVWAVGGFLLIYIRWRQSLLPNFEGNINWRSWTKIQHFWTKFKRGVVASHRDSSYSLARVHFSSCVIGLWEKVETSQFLGKADWYVALGLCWPQYPLTCVKVSRRMIYHALCRPLTPSLAVLWANPTFQTELPGHFYPRFPQATIASLNDPLFNPN